MYEVSATKTVMCYMRQSRVRREYPPCSRQLSVRTACAELENLAVVTQERHLLHALHLEAQERPMESRRGGVGGTAHTIPRACNDYLSVWQPCSLVVSYQRFGGIYCLPEDEGRKFLRNFGLHKPLYQTTRHHNHATVIILIVSAFRSKHFITTQCSIFCYRSIPLPSFCYSRLFVVPLFFSSYPLASFIRYRPVIPILSADSSVTTVTKLRAGKSRSRGSIPSSGKRFLFTPQRPDRLWAPGGRETDPLTSIYCRN
jgi:hypothetical protein